MLVIFPSIILNFQHQHLINEAWENSRFIFLRNGVWDTEFTIEKDTNSKTLSTDWTLLNMNIVSQPNYGIKLVYCGKSKPHADMCFGDIKIIQTIFYI